MGHHKLREDKTCLNCNYVVENKYCPNCGQENTETSQSFHYLFTHFIEDLTHYDGSFWKTIKKLLFQPAALTIEYLSGKRKQSVPPVKLYIFISFVTFLLPTLLPNVTIFGKKKIEKVAPKDTQYLKIDEKDKFFVNDSISVRNIKELDSLQNALPENQKISFAEYTIQKNLMIFAKNKNQREIGEKAVESFIHTLPKVLFIYMPIFALLLWLFHDKKKWYYFDSGVFTLHYFSFLLLLITIGILIDWFINVIYYVEEITSLIKIAFTCYSFFYFFRAHRKFYGESKLVSRSKSLLLFVINVILISLISISIFLYNLFTIH
jgi:Protein of unknown function (DUF3667)